MLPYIWNFIENVTDINFWCLIMLKDCAFQWKKNEIIWLTRSNVMPLTSEREIVPDIPLPFGIGIRLSKKGLSTKFKLWGCSKDLNILNKSCFVADATLSTRN